MLTVEGYDGDPLMRAIRTAFNRRHALQCGFCTPGMLATAYDILSRIADLDRDRIRTELGGNFCRCTGYLHYPGHRRRVRAACTNGEHEAGNPSCGINPGILRKGINVSKRITVNRRQILAAGAGALSTGILPRAALAQGAPVKVGVILYLSGVQAFMGQQTRKGNEFGGKYAKEMGGPPMEFIYGDAEIQTGKRPRRRRAPDPRRLHAADRHERLGSTITVAQAAEAAKIPFLINIASAPQITEQGFTQIFRNFPPATTLVGNAVVH